MKMTREQEQYMEQHREFVRMVQLITSFDFLAALNVLKKEHTGSTQAVTAKTLYQEVYGVDQIYSGMTITESREYVLDKSSQFREALKRFIAIQDFDMEFILKALKKEEHDFSRNEWEELQCCIGYFRDTFGQILGGTIQYRCKETTGVKNPQRFYYFIPDTSDSTMNLLTGMVLSNPLIAQTEKGELLERMAIMNPAYGENLTSVPVRMGKRRKKGEIQIPAENEAFLRHVQILYAAIEKQWKVEIIYGIYDRAEDDTVRFRKKESGREKTYLNPFALLWNRGHYYLVATVDGQEESPRHYRVDRFIQVAFAQDSEKKPVPRCRIPNALLSYYKKNGFQTEKYVQEHPGMRIYQKENFINCTFELTSWEIQMMVDTFGNHLKITEKKREPKTRLDYNGMERQLYMVHVEHIQYDNALSFALQHAEYITVREPLKLVNDVRKWMEGMLKRLDE